MLTLSALVQKKRTNRKSEQWGTWKCFPHLIKSPDWQTNTKEGIRITQWPRVAPLTCFCSCASPVSFSDACWYRPETGHEVLWVLLSIFSCYLCWRQTRKLSEKQVNFILYSLKYNPFIDEIISDLIIKALTHR